MGLKVKNENEIVRKAARGDREAMRRIYDSHSAYLMAVCSRYVPDRDDAKDILQECFIKIFSSLDRFEYRGEGSLKAWMSRIVINDCLKFLRKKASFDVISTERDLPDVAEEDFPDTEEIPADVLHGMISSLPDGYRAVFNLFVLEGKSHREIADMLGIKENSSASQLNRAKAMLARQIREYRRNCL